jgi:hypothetical protein
MNVSATFIARLSYIGLNCFACLSVSSIFCWFAPASSRGRSLSSHFRMILHSGAKIHSFGWGQLLTG